MAFNFIKKETVAQVFSREFCEFFFFQASERRNRKDRRNRRNRKDCRNLRICSKFTGEHLCRSAISIKLQSNLLHIFRTPGGPLLESSLSAKSIDSSIRLIN